MRADLTVTNGRLVTPGGIVTGGLAVREGRITAIASDDDLRGWPVLTMRRGATMFAAGTAAMRPGSGIVLRPTP